MLKNISTIGHCAASDIVVNGHSTLEELVMDLLFGSLNSFGLGPISGWLFLCGYLNVPNYFTGSRDLYIYMHGLI